MKLTGTNALENSDEVIKTSVWNTVSANKAVEFLRAESNMISEFQIVSINTLCKFMLFCASEYKRIYY